MNRFQITFAVLIVLMTGALIVNKAASTFMKILGFVLIFGLVALIIIS